MKRKLKIKNQKLKRVILWTMDYGLWAILIFSPHLGLAADFSSESYYLKARAYEKYGDFSSAIIEYKKALQYDPNSIFLKKSLAITYLYNNEENLALSMLLSITKTNPDIEIWNIIGNIYTKNKRHKTAIEAYNKGLEIKEDINLLYNLAESYLFAKKISDAILTYKRIIKLNPREEPALLSLGLIYDEEGKTKEARPVYERLLEINPKNVFVMKRLMGIYFKEDVGEAENLGKKLVEKEESPESWFLLGMAYEKNNKEKYAEKCYRKVIDSSVKEGFVRFGWLLLKNERDDEGLNMISDGLVKFPDDFELSLLCGIFLSQKKEYSKAITIFKDLIKKSPDDDYLYFQLGIAYDGLSNSDWAIKYLYKAIRLNPKNSSSYNYIGYTWADLGKNLNRALKLIEKALEIEPNNPAYLDSLGWCYYKLGSLDLSLLLLLKAYSLKNDDPVVLEHIGDVYRDKGMGNEANKFYKLSLDKFKEEKDKERILKKLKP